jgi:hypothetical protein
MRDTRVTRVIRIVRHVRVISLMRTIAGRRVIWVIRIMGLFGRR